MLGKSRSKVRPDALGTTLQSSQYGATIPTIYGRTRAALELIWANNFRQISSSKKYKKTKGKKGTPPAWAENVDFLLGHNPMGGVLQAWLNTNQKYPLNFLKYSATAGGFGAKTITVPDSGFYFVVGVTFDQAYNVTFNDYGGQGSQNFTGTFEIPLWNAAYAGPDPINNSVYTHRYSGSSTVYWWVPGSGSTINVLNFLNGGNPGGTFNIYYAQIPTAANTTSKNKNPAGTGIPLALLNLTFETQLGDGPEYGVAYAAQQVIMPHYAGVGSPQFDLGSSGQLPNVRLEVVGSFPLYSEGDSDFADMIEDIFKSGISQAGFAYAGNFFRIQHGLNCSNYPGLVQKLPYTSLFADVDHVIYTLGNRAGNFLVAIAGTDNPTRNPTFTDTAGDTWIPTLSLPNDFQVAYAVSVGAPPGNEVVTSGLGNDDDVGILEVAGVDSLDGSPASFSGTGTVASGSITTTNESGQPAFILAIAHHAVGTVDPIYDSIPHWDRAIDGMRQNRPNGLANIVVYQRTVLTPGTYSIDVPTGGSSPWKLIMLAFKNSQPVDFPMPLGDIIDSDSLDLCRLQCRANGLWGSLNMDSQRKASDWLADLYEAMDSAPVWSGFKLKSFPRSEVSAVGNGAVYNAPTAAGPVAVLQESDFLGDATTPPVNIERKSPRIDDPNIYQLQHPNRGSDYNDVITEQPEASTVALYGPRKPDSPKVLRCVQDVLIARKLAGIAVRRKAYVEPFIYKFKLGAKWKLLEPMDLVTIPLSSIMAADPIHPPSGTLPLRLTSINEDDQFNLDCEAEPFIYGVHAPILMPAIAQSPYIAPTGADPGDVNAPVIFEPVPALYNVQNQRQLWLVVSGASPDYGGCEAMLSTDGGNSYNMVGTLQNGTTGVLAATWAAGADPDVTHDLLLDLTESLGDLASYQVSDEDNFLYPCYVEGGITAIPYEVMTYAVAQQTGTHLYTLKATGTGNHLRRAVFSAPQFGTGVSHASGNRFAFIGAGAPGVLKLVMDPQWIGVTLHFKFLSFNKTGGGLQSLAAVTDYTYIPIGTVGSVNPIGLPPGLVTVN